MFCPFEGTVNLIRQRGNNIQSSDWTSMCSWTMLTNHCKPTSMQVYLLHILHHWQSLCWVKFYVKLLSGFPEVSNDPKKVHLLRMPIIVIIAITIHHFTKSHANGLYRQYWISCKADITFICAVIFIYLYILMPVPLENLSCFNPI